MDGANVFFYGVLSDDLFEAAGYQICQDHFHRVAWKERNNARHQRGLDVASGLENKPCTSQGVKNDFADYGEQDVVPNRMVGFFCGESGEEGQCDVSNQETAGGTEDDSHAAGEAVEYRNADGAQCQEYQHGDGAVPGTQHEAGQNYGEGGQVDRNGCAWNRNGNPGTYGGDGDEQCGPGQHLCASNGVIHNNLLFSLYPM